MWRSVVRSCWFGSGCPVLRTDTRENPVGKNGVMTVAPSLFGISWHKECWTKNKWPDFCPLGFSRFPRSPTAVAQFVSVCVSILPGSKWVFQGLEKIGRDAKKQLGA
jgi:hypothetical protein